MVILHINCADTGSTGKLINEISRCAVGKGHRSFACVPKITGESPYLEKFQTSQRYEQGIYRRISSILGLQYGFAPLSTVRILRAIKKIKPDVVHLHSVNCSMVNIYRLMEYIKRQKIPMIVTNHAEFFYTGSCSHAHECEKWKEGCGNCQSLKKSTGSVFFDRTHKAWKKMKNALTGHRNVAVVSVSPWVYERSCASPIMEGIEQRVILNGVNTEIFHYIDPTLLRQELGIANDRRIILHVTSSFTDAEAYIKNGRDLIELAKRFENDDVYFLVVGKNRVKKQLPANIILMGEIQDQQLLAKCYSMAELCVVTSRNETYGMTVAEALCCGTPVVGFCSGGSESIALPEYSEFVPFGDVDALEQIIRSKWLTAKSEHNNQIMEQAAEKYDSRIMAEQYCALYHRLIDTRVNS